MSKASMGVRVQDLACSVGWLPGTCFGLLWEPMTVVHWFYGRLEAL